MLIAGADVTIFLTGHSLDELERQLRLKQKIGVNRDYKNASNLHLVPQWCQGTHTTDKLQLLKRSPAGFKLDLHVSPSWSYFGAKIWSTWTSILLLVYYARPLLML